MRATAAGTDNQGLGPVFHCWKPGIDIQARHGPCALAVTQVVGQGAAAAGTRRMGHRDAKAVQDSLQRGIDLWRQPGLHTALWDQNAALRRCIGGAATDLPADRDLLCAARVAQRAQPCPIRSSGVNRAG